MVNCDFIVFPQRIPTFKWLCNKKKKTHFTVKHIKSVDGFYGCYRGLTPKLVGSIVSVIGSKKVAAKLQLDEVDANENKDSEELTEEEW